MQYSGLQVVAFVILILVTGAIIASIATNYSSYHMDSQLSGAVNLNSHRGLWRACQEDSVEFGKLFKVGSGASPCQNRFEISFEDGQVDLKHVNVQTWEIACLALMCGSAVLGILSLLFSPCCCNRCGLCLTFWVLLATLCCAAAVGLYAYQTSTAQVKTYELASTATIQLKGPKFDFGWSFWLAVGGGACQLFATLGFGVSRARQHSYSQTI